MNGSNVFSIQSVCPSCKPKRCKFASNRTYNNYSGRTVAMVLVIQIQNWLVCNTKFKNTEILNNS